MVSLREVRAGDVILEDTPRANVGERLSKIRHKMEENRLRTIPVMDGRIFVGMLSYRDMIEKLRSDPSHSKVDPLVHTPPEIEEDMNLVELSSLRIGSGRKKMPLLDDDDHLLGVVGERQIVYPSSETEELAGLKVSDLMTEELFTVREDESFEEARRIMMDEGISRLPVLDSSGELTGIISSLDILRAMVPREQMQHGDVKGHKESLSDVPVSELMETDAEIQGQVTSEPSLSIRNAIEMMREENRLEVIALEEGKPLGIITLKDIISHISDYEEGEGLLVQLSGVKVPEEKKAINDKVENAVTGGLGRIIKNPEELRIHVKKYEKDGKRHKFSLNFKLSSKEGVTTVKSHGWSLMDAVDEGLDELEKVLKKEKERRIDEKRKKQRREKYS